MIVTCGEALIDMVPRNLPEGDDVYLPVPGGAHFNTAIALGRLGEAAGLVTSLSQDLFGDQLMAALAASNVSTALVVHSPQPTTLAFVKLTDGHASYSFFDENSAGRLFQERALPEIPADVDCLHFGGICLIPDPCGATYEALMRRERHRLISFDPNIRQNFVQDETAFRGRISRMAAMADIIKVSDEDLAWLAKGHTSEAQAPDAQAPDALVRDWLAGTAAVVLVTKGAHGVDVYTRDGETTIPAQATTVVDTIGAGDTFNAGFLSGLREAGLLSKETLSAASLSQLTPAVEKAVQVAAVTCCRAGANPPWADELT
ncbi:MAG: carbohydrate kinase [Pseudomonadota bacterium]